MKIERRHALRVAANIATLVEVIKQREVALHPNLEKVYERVKPAEEALGKKFPATIRDLSTNGAFIAGPALPLLSRVAFSFLIEDYGQAEALGWVMWRRSGACEVPIDGDEGGTLQLAEGFGVLFEAIPLEARQAIAVLVGRGEG